MEILVNKSKTPSKETVEEEYLLKKLSCSQIGVKYNKTKYQISYLIKKYGIPLRQSGFLPVEPKNILGMRYGTLVVAEYSYVKNQKRYYRCTCDCGGTIDVTANELDNGHVKSCGNVIHKSGINSLMWEGYGNISKTVFNKIRRNSTRRTGDKLEFDLTIEFLSDLFDKQNKKCAISGLPLKFGTGRQWRRSTTASLDRIDSNKGYVLDNVQWVHKAINQMKSNLNQEEFIDLCHAISLHNTKEKND